jgi:RNA polymerase sigma factor (sigma-70 family)
LERNTITADEIALANRVARRIASRWRAVEEDDIASTLFLWLIENAGTVRKYRDEPGGTGKLYVALRREGNKFAAEEQKLKVGRGLRDDNFYDPARVSRILPYMFEDTPETLVIVNPVTGEPQFVPNEHGMAQAILADVSGAFHGLPRETKEVLYWRFRDGLTLQEISELEGISKVGAKKRVDRAVQRLSDALAGNRL